jgi:K+-sensing histidine kinase KdpD
MQFLFLASHGLRSNLSALRWASGRLLKSSGNQSKEQKHLAQEIYDHTRILTTAFNAMLILGRLEEKELEMKKKELLLLPLLESLRADVQAKPLEWVIECDPHIRLFR